MSHRTRQHRYVAALFFTGLLLIGGGCILLRSAWIPGNLLQWACAAILALFILIRRILTAFAKDPGRLPEACFPGLANRLTAFRGLLTCLLAGFLFLDRPEGLLAWLPGSLYSAALILDGFDGYLARLRHETSAFGAFLDRDLDALGTLIGVLLAVQYGRLPDWFILAGMAYYLFALGQWRRKKRGLPLHPLRASGYRRHVAVVQSVFIALALLPMTIFPESGIVATLVMIPVLAGFLRDWLTVSGYDLRAPAAGRSPGAEKSP
jgi:CDP-diacylglycerol---glycerol-3-phosphate 3-phosphatidyltransferase